MTAGHSAVPFATSAIVHGILEATFARLDDLCARPAALLHHRPVYAGAWTILEHLEHISLANHFLLLTISKGVATALRRARTRPAAAGESDLARLAAIADPGAFSWEPPGHMIPTGTKPCDTVREQLAAQHTRCRELLGRMAAGEGRLCSYRMSVCGLGKLDMYQWLYFLAQHGCWHLQFLQMRAAGGQR